MKWRLFSKNDEHLSDEIKRLGSRLDDMAAKLDEKDEQLQKLTRLTYKNGKQLEEKLDGMARHLQDKPANSSNGVPVESVVLKLVTQLDDLDMVDTELNGDSPWKETIKKWQNQLISTLSDFGVKVRLSPGEPFDPALCEAIGTVSETGKRKPGTIAVVHKRAVINSDGTVIRKGQVLTAKESEA